MTRNTPQPQQKKSFILFHITVIQCPAVASIHDNISTKGGGGGKRAMHDSCFKKKKGREREGRNKDKKKD